MFRAQSGRTKRFAVICSHIVHPCCKLPLCWGGAALFRINALGFLQPRSQQLEGSGPAFLLSFSDSDGRSECGSWPLLGRPRSAQPCPWCWPSPCDGQTQCCSRSLLRRGSGGGARRRICAIVAATATSGSAPLGYASMQGCGKPNCEGSLCRHSCLRKLCHGVVYFQRGHPVWAGA